MAERSRDREYDLATIVSWILQSKVLLIGSLTIVVMCLFPPWSQVIWIPGYLNNVGRPRVVVVAKGYDFVASMPGRVGSDELKEMKIDLRRLAVQCLAVGLATISIAIFTSSSRRISKDGTARERSIVSRLIDPEGPARK